MARPGVSKQQAIREGMSDREIDHQLSEEVDDDFDDVHLREELVRLYEMVELELIKQDPVRYAITMGINPDNGKHFTPNEHKDALETLNPPITDAEQCRYDRYHYFGEGSNSFGRQYIRSARRTTKGMLSKY